MPEISLTLAFFAGLASFLAPCSLVMTPTLLVFLASSKSKRIHSLTEQNRQTESGAKEGLFKEKGSGETEHTKRKLRENKNLEIGSKINSGISGHTPKSPGITSKIIIYSFGFYLAFLTLAFSILGPLSLFSEFRREIIFISGFFMVIFGISGIFYRFLPSLHIQEIITHFGDFLTKIFLKLYGSPTNSQKISLADYRETPIFAGLFGFLTAFSWTPCLGPVAGSILSLASADDSLGKALLTISFFVFGLKTPLVIWGLYVDFVHKKIFGSNSSLSKKITKLLPILNSEPKNTKSVDSSPMNEKGAKSKNLLNSLNSMYYYFFNGLFVLLGIMVMTGQYEMFVGELENFLQSVGIRFL